MRPGGTVVFHEPDWTDARCSPPSATYRQVCDWIRQALVASGADDVLGTRLAAVFALAGLPLPTLGFDALVAAGPPARDVVRLVTDLATTLRPDIERLGLVASGDPDFAELAESILTDLGPHGTAVRTGRDRRLGDDLVPASSGRQGVNFSGSSRDCTTNFIPFPYRFQLGQIAVNTAKNDH